jgi:tellurite methyltransferase
MKKKLLINYWDSYYRNNKKFKESTFARFVKKKIIIKNRNNRMIDIGCGNGRDSFYFSKNKLRVTAIDISKNAIRNNAIRTNPNLNFINFDIEKKTMSKKFDFIYCRFFIHAINEKAEDKLFKLFNKIKKKNTLAFLEFRNDKDTIFDKNKNKYHNNIVEFEKGHFRRIINLEKFIFKIKKQVGCKIKYKKSSKNLSVYKKDNPNLSRLILKF